MCCAPTIHRFEYCTNVWARWCRGVRAVCYTERVRAVCSGVDCIAEVVRLAADATAACETHKCGNAGVVTGTTCLHETACRLECVYTVAPRLADMTVGCGVNQNTRTVQQCVQVLPPTSFSSGAWPQGKHGRPRQANLAQSTPHNTMGVIGTRARRCNSCCSPRRLAPTVSPGGNSTANILAPSNATQLVTCGQ